MQLRVSVSLSRLFQVLRLPKCTKNQIGVSGLEIGRQKWKICRQILSSSHNCQTRHFTPWKGRELLRNVQKRAKVLFFMVKIHKFVAFFWQSSSWLLRGMLGRDSVAQMARTRAFLQCISMKTNGKEIRFVNAVCFLFLVKICIPVRKYLPSSEWGKTRQKLINNTT